MAVSLTVSETLGGATPNDALAGGGTGIDLGAVTSGQFAPIVDQASNNGKMDVFITHNATKDPITNVRTFVQQFGTGTGFTYGGANSAAADFTKLLTMGNTSAMGSAVANNSDGLGNGFHIDMQWNVSQTNQFLSSRVGTFVRIYGSGGGAASGIGKDLASAIILKADAMSRNNSGTEVAPTGAVDGIIGKAGDTVYGDTGHPRVRFYLKNNETDGGYLQWELVIAYQFTS